MGGGGITIVVAREDFDKGPEGQRARPAETPTGATRRSVGIDSFRTRHGDGWGNYSPTAEIVCLELRRDSYPTQV